MPCYISWRIIRGPDGVVKLSGRMNSGWRVRVGDYRILYRIEEHRVDVYRIKHRRDAYRQ